MRVIAGSARGTQLVTPEGQDTRPTTDKVREAVYGSLQFRLRDARVLDLFAGSGAMGIEALSRGAAHCTFIDKARTAVNCVNANIKKCRLESTSTVLCTDSAAWLKTATGKFDIIILDPPYASGIYESVMGVIKERELLAEDGIVVLEHDGSIDIEGFEKVRDKRYGKIHVTMYESEKGL